MVFRPEVPEDVLIWLSMFGFLFLAEVFFSLGEGDFHHGQNAQTLSTEMTSHVYMGISLQRASFSIFISRPIFFSFLITTTTTA